MNADPTAARDQALAIEYHSAGRLDDAEQIYQRLLAADRQNPDVLYLLGVLCCDLGLFQAACRLLEQALTISPKFPEARTQWAIAQSALTGAALLRGEWAAAEAHAGASLAQRAGDVETLNWLGLAQVNLGTYAAAEAALRQALAQWPDLDQAHNNLGLALHHQGRLGEAQTCFERALANDPGYRAARINLANTLRIGGRHAQAREELETLLAAQPEAVDVLNNLGAVLQDLGESDLALTALTRALALAPEAPQIRWNIALTQLQRGDFRQGWSNFESRWTGCDHLRGGYQMPEERAWRGEPLSGKRLLLWAEQGFGDTLQFIRFAQDAARQGALVSVSAQLELHDLLRSAPGVAAVSPAGDPIPDYDFHCPLMSLPFLLQVAPTAESLHGMAAYLTADAERSKSWRSRMTGYSGLKVGLVWAGSSRQHSAELAAIDARRSISLERLTPLLAVPGCSFFSLQKGAAAVEAGRSVGARPLPIEDFSAEWRDFSDTAAFVTHLDLVVSVDTAVAHLAGALGKPVWLLNRYDACWRWLLGRQDSPWYGGLRQFRQPTAGDWNSAIAEAARALGEAAGGLKR